MVVANKNPQTVEHEVEGVVKWYSQEKGFGFIHQVKEFGGKDIFLPRYTIEDFGLETITTGTRIKALVVLSPKGPKIKSITEIRKDTKDNYLEKTSATNYAERPWVSAYVRTLEQKDRGFCFLQGVKENKGIMLHANVLRASEIAVIYEGQILEVKTGKTNKGMLAIEARLPIFKANALANKNKNLESKPSWRIIM
jgi:CspA family cold shock protein